MKKEHLIIAACILAWLTAAPARAAVLLASLNNPTLQTLMTMGSSSVVVGDMQFSNFTFTDNSTGTALAPSQIRVQPYTTTGNGLEFVAGWFASNGSTLDDLISYDVQTTTPGQPIGEVTLLTNGTAPVAATGTFTTASLLSQTTQGSTAAPVISTYNAGADGDSNINFASTALIPQQELFETTTLFGNTEGAGVVTASVLENAYISVPEPRTTGLVMLPLLGLLLLISRPFFRTAR
jgi:hypothetical protein